MTVSYHTFCHPFEKLIKVEGDGKETISVGEWEGGLAEEVLYGCVESFGSL